jgi:alpha-N-acetylglucosamine transferase
MTQYSRILVLDGDTVLVKPLDGVFKDPGAQIRQTKEMSSYKPLDGEAPLPKTYLLASLSEVWDSTHEFPPKEGWLLPPRALDRRLQSLQIVPRDP